MPSEGHKLLIGVFRRRWRGPIKNAANFTPYWLQPVRVAIFLLSDSKDSQKKDLSRSWFKEESKYLHLQNEKGHQLDIRACHQIYNEMH